MSEFHGKVAVITGGGSGLGRELALACARRGMRVAVGDVDVPGMAETERLLKAEAPAAEYFSHKLDVSKLDNVQTFAGRVFDRFGAVYVLFNNAGVAASGTLWSYSENDWKWVLGVNLLGVAWGIKAFVPRMMATGEGHVVNIASAAGWAYVANLGVYNASKSAVVAISETLLGDLRSTGSQLGVSVVCPSFFRTGIGEAGRNRPAELANQPNQVAAVEAESEEARLAREQREAWVANAVETSPVQAKDIAEMTLQAVEQKRFYVFPHPEIKEYITARARNVTSDWSPPGT
jgi:NAD(P)-dependent dehydrogenase (short-subunit alcohol dehydrogenase family)